MPRKAIGSSKSGCRRLDHRSTPNRGGERRTRAIRKPTRRRAKTKRSLSCGAGAGAGVSREVFRPLPRRRIPPWPSRGIAEELSLPCLVLDAEPGDLRPRHLAFPRGIDLTAEGLRGSRPTSGFVTRPRTWQSALSRAGPQATAKPHPWAPVVPIEMDDSINARVFAARIRSDVVLDVLAQIGKPLGQSTAFSPQNGAEWVGREIRPSGEHNHELQHESLRYSARGIVRLDWEATPRPRAPLSPRRSADGTSSL
jgi:hypothetical protein